MVVNITKLIKYRPLSKSVKGIEALNYFATERGLRVEDISKAFSLFLAIMIRRNVMRAVKTQTLNGKPMMFIYKSLSPKYNRTKPLNTQNKFWRNTDFLITNLKVWQLKNGDVFIGYRGNAVHKGTKYKTGQKRIKASQIMVYLERGTSRIPARPLFSVVVTSIAKNIGYYFEMFLKQVDKGQVRVHESNK